KQQSIFPSMRLPRVGEPHSLMRSTTKNTELVRRCGSRNRRTSRPTIYFPTSAFPHLLRARRRKRMLRRILAILSIALILPLPQIQAQTPAKFELTIDNIMRGSEMIGTEPTRIRWSQDSQRIYFNWKQPGEPADKDPDLYMVNHDGSGLVKLSEKEAEKAPPADGELSKDRKLSVFAEDGDLFLYDHTRGDRRRLTKTADIESDPHFTFDQHGIYFTRSNNLYVLSLENGQWEKMTALVPPAPPMPQSGPPNRNAQSAAQNQSQSGEQQGTASQEYIKKEERELFDVVKRRAHLREERE